MAIVSMIGPMVIVGATLAAIATGCKVPAISSEAKQSLAMIAFIGSVVTVFAFVATAHLM